MEKGVLLIMHRLLLKLINRRIWGGKHTEYRNLFKSLPLEYTSDKSGQKLIKKAIKELKNKEFLLSKPSTGEEHFFLNPRKVKEIWNFIREIEENLIYKN